MWWWILSLVNTWERCLFSQWHRWPASKLSGALWRLGGKRKESLQLRLWNLNSTSNSPVAPRRLSCQISANQREAETSANVNKHWKTRAKGNDVITNVISANQHFASTFSMQIFKFQRRSCKLSFLFPPRHQSAPESLLEGYDTGGWKEKIRVLQTVEPITSCSVVQMLYHQATGDSVADPGEGGTGGVGPPFIFGPNRKNFLGRPPSPHLLSKGLDDRGPLISRSGSGTDWDSWELRKLELGLCDKQSCKETFCILLGLECTVPSVFRAACVTCWVSIFHMTKKKMDLHIFAAPCKYLQGANLGN